MTAANLVFACAQIALLVAICAPLPRLLGLRSPSVQYVFWRVLLAACVLLPALEPRQPAEMAFVPASAAAMADAPAPPAPQVSGPSAALPALDWVTVAKGVIAAGIALRLAWIAIGMLRLHRMRRRAAERASGFGDLEQAIGVTAPILWSRDVAHPVTFGVMRPVVLLPFALTSVDATAQRAVVAHELHHVKRRDWLWVVAEEIVRSLLWFHPAVWWLISRVQLARETVVDELSILTTNARRAYLDTLLAFADDTGLQSSPAFSARRHLFHRVMLLSKEGSMSSIRIASASGVLALALVAGSWGAVQAFPLYGPAQQREQAPPPPPPPPRDPLSPEAYIRLGASYLDQIWKDRSLTESQKLELLGSGIAALDRALELKPNYADAMIWKSILLRTQARFAADSVEQSRLINEADALLEQAKVLSESGRAYVSRDMISGPPPPPPPPPPRPTARGVQGGVSGGVPGGVPGGVAGGVGQGREDMVFVPAPPMPEAFERRMKELNPVRIGGTIKAPAMIRDVKPVYPPIARQAKVTGVVIIEALVDADGNVADARVLKSIPLLDQAALDAVQQWTFVPLLLNGAPTAVVMTVTVNFALK